MSRRCVPGDSRDHFLMVRIFDANDTKAQRSSPHPGGLLVRVL